MISRVTPVLVRLVGWSARHAWPVLAGGAVVVLLSVIGVARLRASPSLSDMFGGGSPAAEAMERIARDFRAADELLVVATSPTAAGEPAEQLAAYAAALERAIATDPAAAGMTASVRFRRDDWLDAYLREVALPAGAYFLPDEGFAELMRRLTPEGMRTQLRRAEALVAAPGPAAGAIAAEVLRDPLRLAELMDAGAPGPAGGPDGGPSLTLSHDGRSLLIRVAGRRQVDDLDFSRRFTDRIGALAGAANTGGLTIEIGGGYAIAATTSRGIRADAILSVLVSVALLHAVFAVFYRSIGAPLLIVGVAGVGILAGFGVQGGLAPQITPLTAVVAAMLAGLGIDYGIHFLAHYQTSRSLGLSTVASSEAAAASVGVPITTNCLTTVFGFASLWPSQVRMLSDFAALGTLGLLGSLVSVLILMPALLAVTDRRGAGAVRPPRFGAMAGAIERRPLACIALAGAVLAGAASGLIARDGGVRLETDLSVMHPRPNRPLELIDALPGRFPGFQESMPVEVSAPSPGQLAARAHAAAAALRSEAVRRAGVTGVLGLHQLVPDPEVAAQRAGVLAGLDPDAMTAAFDAAVAASPFNPEAFAEYREFLRRMVREPPPGPVSLRSYPAVAERVLAPAPAGAGEGEERALLVAVLARPLGERGVRDSAVEAMRLALAGVPGATLSGMSAVAYDLERATRADLPRSVAISLGLVVAWLLLVFGRPLDVALALVPLVFAIVVTLGVVAWAGLRMNAINGVALPLLDGIAVDAGVFLVAAARARRHGESGAFRSTAQAVLAASVTTIAGFAALCLTSTPAIRSLGMLASAGVAASLCGAVLLLLPVLLLRSAPPPRTGAP